MPGTWQRDRGALYVVAIVLAVAIAAVAMALIISTALPVLTILVGAGALWIVAFIVISLAAS